MIGFGGFAARADNGGFYLFRHPIMGALWIFFLMKMGIEASLFVLERRVKVRATAILFHHPDNVIWMLCIPGDVLPDSR
jgi:hypothetical protein